MEEITNSSRWGALLLQRKVLSAEIKSHEQEYKRLQNQIKDLEDTQSNLWFKVQKKLDAIEKIGHKMDEIETELLIKAGL